MKQKIRPWLLITILVLLVGAITTFIVLNTSSDKLEEDSKFYYNLHATIVSMNGSDIMEVGKYSTPTNVKIALIKGENGMYAELSSKEMWKIVTDKWWYNHKVGDSIFFEYIRKDRFFTIDSTK
jgi:hypothetical protein